MKENRKTEDISDELLVMSTKLEAIVQILTDYFTGPDNNGFVSLMQSSLTDMARQLNSYSDASVTIQPYSKEAKL